MTLRILVISDYRETHGARPEAETFIQLAQRGHAITIMTYPGAAYIDRFTRAGIRVIPWHPAKKFDRQESARIRQELQAGSYHYLHLFNSQATLTGLRAARGIPVRVALYRGYAGNIHWWDPTAYLKYLHPRVRMIWCNAPSIKDLIDRQLWFIHQARTFAIPKGHDRQWYSDVTPLNLHRELGLDESAIILINVANNRRMKGIPVLLRAMTQLPPDIPIHLALVGHGMDTSPHRTILQEAGRTDRVHFLGYRKDAMALTAGANIFVLSSLFGESHTKALIEALALGTPAIMTDIPGNRGVVLPDETGLVVPAGDHHTLSQAILRLAQNKDLQAQFRAASFRHLDGPLHTSRTADQLEAAYIRLINQEDK